MYNCRFCNHPSSDSNSFRPRNILLPYAALVVWLFMLCKTANFEYIFTPYQYVIPIQLEVHVNYPFPHTFQLILSCYVPRSRDHTYGTHCIHCLLSMQSENFLLTARIVLSSRVSDKFSLGSTILSINK